MSLLVVKYLTKEISQRNDVKVRNSSNITPHVESIIKLNYNTGLFILNANYFI